jgi:hypothetical protein
MHPINAERTLSDLRQVTIKQFTTWQSCQRNCRKVSPQACSLHGALWLDQVKEMEGIEARIKKEATMDRGMEILQTMRREGKATYFVATNGEEWRLQRVTKPGFSVTVLKGEGGLPGDYIDTAILEDIRPA